MYFSTISLPKAFDVIHSLNETLDHKLNRIANQMDFKEKHRDAFRSLTRREVEILSLITQGFSNNKIADKLFISTKTVEQHRKNIKRKLKSKTTWELTQFALAFDLI